MAEENNTGEAASKAVDPTHLLNGENPETQYPEDAKHWISVYCELREFKSRMIDNVRSAADRVSSDARQEIESTDLQILQAEYNRFDTRVSFWERRLQELAQQRS